MVGIRRKDDTPIRRPASADGKGVRGFAGGQRTRLVYDFLRRRCQAGGANRVRLEGKLPKQRERKGGFKHRRPGGFARGVVNHELVDSGYVGFQIQTILRRDLRHVQACLLQDLELFHA